MEKAKKYLSDILLAINLIEDFLNSTEDFQAYQVDIRTKSAVERQLSIVGEAVNNYRKLGEAYTLTHDRQIVAFRNLIIHAYDNIDDTIVWTIVKRHLPELKKEVNTRLV